MKNRYIIMTLIVVLVMTAIGCGKKQEGIVVEFGYLYQYTESKDLIYDDKIVLVSEDFKTVLTELNNKNISPDTAVYDEVDNVIGTYDYDPETGMAVGWTNLADGVYTEFPEEEWLQLGEPDNSQSVEIEGSISMGAVVYENKGTANRSDLYFIFSNENDKENMKKKMEELFGLTLTDESGKILKVIQDKTTIQKMLKAEKVRDASAYADYLKMVYRVKEYVRKDIYEPFTKHKRPEGLAFDETVVMTGSGAWAVMEDYADNIKSTTDYVYGKDGKVVARYTYYECVTKEAADQLMKDGMMAEYAERYTDTVILEVTKGQEMQQQIEMHKKYHDIEDSTVDEYVKMLEKTLFIKVWE